MSRTHNSKVVKYKRTKFNIGSVLFFIILLYVLFVSVHFLRKEHISIYEVNEKQMSDDNMVTGIALRTEHIYTASNPGYVSYYNGNGEKVARYSTIYTLDSTGEYSDKLASLLTDVNISNDDIENIRTDIRSYRSDFQFSDYSNVYDFKYSIESTVLSLTSEAMISQIDSINTQGNGNSFEMFSAAESGVITYWTDGLEEITENAITESLYDEDNYEKIQLKTSDSVQAGDAVCKIVTDENWNIIVKLDEKQYQKLEEKDSVKIRFCKDDLEINVPFTLFSNDGINYANLSLNKYMSRYIDDRYIDIELLLNSAEGLKIPVSSILEKNCYIVPVGFLAKGGNSDNEVLSCEVTNEDGSKSLKEIDTFAMKDEEYVYIDTLLLHPGTNIYKPDSQDKYQIGEIRSLKGVYNVNEGYCQFKHVDIIYENKEYCIVKKDMPYGLAVYDHIVINQDRINENDIIY